MPYENIVDTLLHELTHIVQGPHDATFQKIWDELRTECEALIAKGYTGEGFIGKGQVVGGRRMPVEEAHRLARRRAEEQYSRTKRAAGTIGHLLGGKKPASGSDIRGVIAEAADRRSTVIRGCPTESHDVINLTDKYGHGGRRITADDHDADNDELTKALIDLLQNDEERKLNGLPPLGASSDSPIPIYDSPQSSRTGRSAQSAPPVPGNKPSSVPPTSRPVDRFGRPISRLVNEADHRRSASANSRQHPPAAPAPTSSNSSYSQRPQPRPQPRPQTTMPVSAVWSCNVCTLDNLLHHEKCEACDNPRPAHVMGDFNYGQWASGSTPVPQKQRENTLGWICHSCGTFMPHEWWTCSSCGGMKLSS